MWVDADYVVQVTGKEASEESLALAHSIVSIIAGLDDETDISLAGGIVSTRNARHLKHAVAFQAVWLDAHPDAVEAMDVTGVSQDGLSATYASAYAAYLSPLANLCLKRVSWRNAPLRVATNRRIPLDVGDRDSAVRDDAFEWSPMSQAGVLGQRVGQVWR